MSQIIPSTTTPTKYSASPHSDAQQTDGSADSKNCKLCRKRLLNEHFYNPKTGLLFSVCDICRKRKRDKYWKNKELLQQSTMNTRLSTRSKVLRTRKAAEVSPDHRIERSAESSPSSTEYYSSPTLSQGNSSVHSSVENGMCNTIPHGSLIVIPPHVSAFIDENRNNPPVLRSYLGDYYWNALCL
ncbi:hypothetical protein WA556_003457 [Blastocystis sp. ATCC 50177/Nand II]